MHRGAGARGCNEMFFLFRDDSPGALLGPLVGLMVLLKTAGSGCRYRCRAGLSPARGRCLALGCESGR